MRTGRPIRRVILGLGLYFAFSAVAGIFLADGVLHPIRRPLTEDETAAERESIKALDAELEDASITTVDGTVLHAWLIRPRPGNGSAVILLHGLADNRLGMAGYGRLLLSHGFTVLMPDARAHGASGGTLATYGLFERDDIHEWFDFLQEKDDPACIYGLGESMGAAQLLQSLATGIHFCAVAAESSFANFREIAYDRMGQPFHLGPWVGRTLLRPLVESAFLRARWKFGLSMQEISPEDSVRASSVPVLLIHGQMDRNVPVHHSRLIHAHNPTTQLWEVPGADHCGAISAGPREFEQKLLEWFAADASIPAGSSQNNKPNRRRNQVR
jgi:uncharacterized protein